MNRKETKKAIEVMQAFVDGVETEYCSKPDGVNWYRVDTYPVWSWGINEYRIKPKPREFLLYPLTGRPSKWGVDEDVLNKGWNGAIKVREVL